MAMAGDNGGRFKVHCSPVIARAFRDLQRQASESGRGERVLAAFREILEWLKRDASNAGEPLYRLPALRLQVRTCVIGPLVVDFAVSEDRPLVFIKGVQLLSA
jgi:hypothetical protein